MTTNPTNLSHRSALAALAAAVGSPDAVDREAALKFGLAFQEYLEASAAVAKENANVYADSEDRSDARTRESARARENASDRLRRAQHALILTPPELQGQLVQKFEALEAIVWDGAYNGWPADNRHLLMLTAVKADLYRFFNRKSHS
jgi:hypothetical protein